MLLRQKLNLLILTTGTVAALMIYAVSIWVLENFLTQNESARKQAITSSIRQDIEVFDRLLLLAESQWDEELSQTLPKLAEDLQGLSPDELSSISQERLQDFRDKYALSDLHLINPELKVFASTSPAEVGLDMTGYGKEYESELRRIFNRDAFFTHRVSLSTVNGNIKKYAYYSAADSDLIVNGDYDLASRLKSRNDEQIADFLFGDYVKELVNKYQEIDKIDLYIVSEVDQWSLFDAGKKIPDKLARELFSGEYKLKDDQNYILEHVNLQSYRQVGFKAFLELSFDTSLIENTKTQLRIFLLIVAFVLAFISILVLHYLSKTFVVDRFSNLLNQLRERQGGNTEQIHLEGDDELSILGHEINEMMARIKREEDMNKWLKGISHKDSLTGLANRRWFDERFEYEYSKAKLTKEALSVIMIDIDNFKQYNDLHGHLKGDDCLCQVARIISKQLSRPSDAVARFGGEEFICILPNTDHKGAKTIATTMRSAVEQAKLPHGDSDASDYVTISLGSYSYDGNDRTAASEILKRSDDLLYQAKRKGRNRVCSNSNTEL